MRDDVMFTVRSWTFVPGLGCEYALRGTYIRRMYIVVLCGLAGVLEVR